MNQETISADNPANWLRLMSVPLGLLVMALQGIRTIGHADFWTHLATGRWIAGHGIPREDPLTLASEGVAWVHSSWLYDRLLYMVWNGGGAGLVTLVHVVAVLAAFYLLVRMVRPHVSEPAIGLALLVSAWLLAPRFEARPELLCFIFPALFLYILSTPRTGWFPFAVLLPAQIVWTNLSASFVWGPMIALLFAAQAFWQSNNASVKKAKSLRLLALAAALLLVSLLINPYGPAMVSAALAAWTAPVLVDWISPFSALFPSSLPWYMVALGLIIGALGLLTRKEKLPIAWTSMAVISAFLVVQSMPVHIAGFALFAFPFFCLSLQAAGDLFCVRLTKSAPDRLLSARQALGGVFLVLCLISMVALISNRYYVRTGDLSSFGVGVVTDAYPAAAQTLIEHPDFPERFLNLPVDGGYLAWRNPDRRVFIDQRGALHAPNLYNELAQGLLGQTEAWATVLSAWYPEAIIVNNTWPYAADIIRHLQAQQLWETIYFDGATTILLLGTSPHAELLDGKDTFLQAGLQTLEQHRRRYRKDLSKAIRPAVPAPLIGAGAIFLARGYEREAAACYELLVYGAPRMLEAQLNVGICQTRLNQFEEAIQTLSRVMDKFPHDSGPWINAHLHMGISQAGASRYTHAIRHLNIVTQSMPNHVRAWFELSRAYTGVGQTTDARQALERARALDPDRTAALQRARINP